VPDGAGHRGSVACPDRRWWKGAGVGIAAGIKLVPLIFIPYLLLTRRFRQGRGRVPGPSPSRCCWGSARLPRDSRKFWAGRAFRPGRPDRIRRLGGEPVPPGDHHQARRERRGGAPDGMVGGRGADGDGRPWRGAAVLDRAGHRMLGLLDLRADRAAGLTGQLGSPLGVDRAPARVAAAVYAVRGPGARRPGGPRQAWPPGSPECSGPGRGGLWSLPAKHRRVLRGADLGTSGYRPGTLLQARRPAVVRRVPLARAADDHRETCTSWPGSRLFALLVALAVRGRGGSGRPRDRPTHSSSNRRLSLTRPERAGGGRCLLRRHEGERGILRETAGPSSHRPESASQTRATTAASRTTGAT